MPRTRSTLLRPSLIVAAMVPLPGVAVHFGLFHAPVLVEAVLFGAAIMGAAFLLSWAAEVAQLDVSQKLAIAVLALIAVLPEYAVDLYLAFCGGRGDENCRHYAVANMTGANRLLIGIGWATVVLVYWAKSRRGTVHLRPEQRTDIGFLLAANLWAFTIPMRGNLSLIDFLVLGSLFGAYLFRAAKEEVEEPELVGAAAAIATLPRLARRIVTVGMFVFAAAVILSSAEPFATSLIEVGTAFGISKFLLIQWVAPLASEAPEMIIAVIFTLRLRAQAGMGTLISSLVNQWTLLVGTLPLVYSLAGAGLTTPLQMDSRQVEEVLLTAAQSVFALAVIADLSISRFEAVAILGLFAVTFAVPIEAVRIGFAIGYVVLAVGMFVANRGVRRNLVLSIRHVTGARPG